MHIGVRRKSVHVNFRIAVKSKEFLEAQASRRDMHLNAYVNHIFAKFAFLDEIIEESHSVVFQREVLSKLLLLAPTQDLAELARSLSARLLKPALEFLEVRSMSDLAERHFLPMGVYSGWYSSKIVKTSSGCKLVLQHDYGPNWTLFLKEYYSETIRSLIQEETRILSRDGTFEIRYR